MVSNNYEWYQITVINNSLLKVNTHLSYQIHPPPPSPLLSLYPPSLPPPPLHQLPIKCDALSDNRQWRFSLPPPSSPSLSLPQPSPPLHQLPIKCDALSDNSQWRFSLTRSSVFHLQELGWFFGAVRNAEVRTHLHRLRPRTIPVCKNRKGIYLMSSVISKVFRR